MSLTPTSLKECSLTVTPRVIKVNNSQNMYSTQYLYFSQIVWKDSLSKTVFKRGVKSWVG